MNGGMDQPECYTASCSHSLSHSYFSEALFESHIFSGAKCVGHITNFITRFLGIDCSEDTDRMGIYSQRKNGRFFVETKAESPYAMQIVEKSEIRVGRNGVGRMPETLRERTNGQPERESREVKYVKIPDSGQSTQQPDIQHPYEPEFDGALGGEPSRQPFVSSSRRSVRNSRPQVPVY